MDGIPAVVEVIEGRPSRRTLERANGIAEVLSLPATPDIWGEHSRTNPCWYATDEIELVVPRIFDTTFSRTERPSVAIWPVDTPEELERSVAEILNASSARDSAAWRVRENATFWPPGDGGAFFLAASRDGSKAEGILIAHRRTDVLVDNQHVYHAGYLITGNFLYVAKPARKQLLAAAMTACLCNQIESDLTVLARSLANSPYRIKLETTVRGDAYSRGGQQFFEDVMAAFESYIPPDDLPRTIQWGEPEPDYSY